MAAVTCAAFVTAAEPLATAGVLVGRTGLPLAVATAGAVLLAVWLIGFVNAFNFMDGVNGISGAHVAAADLLAVYLRSPVLLGSAPALSPAEVELDVEAEAA
jgi:UDP-GlcNAc:undecaprenyl-phosphate/decaprenyl-phosphate GlcNAc-1-phosphate transferase